MRIRTVGFIVTLVLRLLAAPLAAEAQKAVFVVRHAERLDDSKDFPLSEAGQRRAQALAFLLKDSSINAIYVSHLQRTIKTAEPLAKVLKLGMKKVAQYEDGDMEKPVAEFRARHAQDTVLVVGHSNTMPALIKRLGHLEEIKIGRDEYDLVMLVIPRSEGRPNLLRFRF